MRQTSDELSVETRGPGLVEITRPVADAVRAAGIAQGLLTLFCRHTSCSLTIQENADPDVRRDLADFFARLVSRDPALYRHTTEGPDDMPAHIRSALTAVQLAVPVERGRLGLGPWQGIYLFEHRDRPQRRRIALHLLGE